MLIVIRYVEIGNNSNNSSLKNLLSRLSFHPSIDSGIDRLESISSLENGIDIDKKLTIPIPSKTRIRTITYVRRYSLTGQSTL